MRTRTAGPVRLEEYSSGGSAVGGYGIDFTQISIVMNEELEIAGRRVHEIKHERIGGAGVLYRLERIGSRTGEGDGLSSAQKHVTVISGTKCDACCDISGAKGRERLFGRKDG